METTTPDFNGKRVLFFTADPNEENVGEPLSKKDLTYVGKEGSAESVFLASRPPLDEDVYLVTFNDGHVVSCLPEELKPADFERRKQVECMEFGQPFIHAGRLFYIPHDQPCEEEGPEGRFVLAKRVTKDGRLNPRGRYTKMEWGMEVEPQHGMKLLPSLHPTGLGKK